MPVLSEHELRAFTQSEKQKRSQHAINTVDDLHTFVGGGLWDNKHLNARQRAYARRLSRIQSHSYNYSSRRQKQVVAKAKVYCTNLFIDYSQIRDKMDYAYKRLVKQEKEGGMMRGRSIEAFTACLVLGSARGSGLYLSLDEIADASIPVKREPREWKKELFRTWKVLRYETDVLTQEFLEGSNPENNIPRWCAQLELPNEVEKVARRLYTTVLSEIRRNPAKHEDLRQGGAPNGPVAGSVYIAARIMGEKRNQKEVSALAGMTEVTLRKYYKAIEKMIGIR